VLHSAAQGGNVEVLRAILRSPRFDAFSVTISVRDDLVDTSQEFEGCSALEYLYNGPSSSMSPFAGMSANKCATAAREDVLELLEKVEEEALEDKKEDLEHLVDSVSMKEGRQDKRKIDRLKEIKRQEHLADKHSVGHRGKHKAVADIRAGRATLAPEV